MAALANKGLKPLFAGLGPDIWLVANASVDQMRLANFEGVRRLQLEVGLERQRGGIGGSVAGLLFERIASGRFHFDNGVENDGLPNISRRVSEICKKICIVN